MFLWAEITFKPSGCYSARMEGNLTLLSSASHCLACEKHLRHRLGCLRCMQESTRYLRIPHLKASNPAPHFSFAFYSVQALPPSTLGSRPPSQWLIGAGRVGSARYLLLDEGPNDPGHLIPVHFHHRVGNLDSLVSIYREDGIRGGKAVTLPVPQISPLDNPRPLRGGSNAGQARLEASRLLKAIRRAGLCSPRRPDSSLEPAADILPPAQPTPPAEAFDRLANDGCLGASNGPPGRRIKRFWGPGPVSRPLQGPLAPRRVSRAAATLLPHRAVAEGPPRPREGRPLPAKGQGHAQRTPGSGRPGRPSAARRAPAGPASSDRCPAGPAARAVEGGRRRGLRSRPPEAFPSPTAPASEEGRARSPSPAETSAEQRRCLGGLPPGAARLPSGRVPGAELQPILGLAELQEPRNRRAQPALSGPGWLPMPPPPPFLLPALPGGPAAGRGPGGRRRQAGGRDPKVTGGGRAAPRAGESAAGAHGGTVSPGPGSGRRRGAPTRPAPHSQCR